MELFRNLFEGYPNLWGGGVAHSVLILSLVIAFGIMLGKIKVAGISLGVTWILFVGIVFGHFNLNLDEHLLHFLKEFGLILFVYSVGLQVGPGFFSAFKKGGFTLNLLAMMVVFLGVTITIILHFITGVPITTMVGILSGAVTNTPGLGAAQQANSDLNGIDAPEIALGYAVAYPFGVAGIILSMLFLRVVTRVNMADENRALEQMRGEHGDADRISVLFSNGALEGQNIAHLSELINRSFVISRIKHADGSITIADGNDVLKVGDRLRLISSPEDTEAIVTFLGQRVDMPMEEWGAGQMAQKQLVSRRIIITKSEINGKRLSDLHLRSRYGINITRINRAGFDLIPYQGMELQMGDRVMVVGNEKAIEQVAGVLGNSLKKLREPQLLTIFLGIALGVLIGSIPLVNMPQPVKLGLAGGPLIVALLIGRFGPHFHLVTYTTMSANLMLREVGLALFLACVGISSGDGFAAAIAGGGYRWIGYGFIITVVPTVLVGLFARLKLKMSYYTLMGLIAGSTTDSPALGYAGDAAGNDMPAVGYATVYPVVMFLRVLTAQMLILAA